MADGNTPNLNLIKPEVGASPDSWGGKLNDNMDAIDQAVAGKAPLSHKHPSSDVTDLAAVISAAVAAGTMPAGTRLLFQQSAAPTGWTKDTTHNDKALRVVNGAVGAGGSLSFTSAFGAARSVSGTTSSAATTGAVGDTALSISQIPAHDHLIVSATSGSGSPTNTNYLRQTWDGTTNLDYSLKASTTAPTLGLTSQAGGGAAHTHSFTGGAHDHSFSATLDVSVAYVDVIIAVKN